MGEGSNWVWRKFQSEVIEQVIEGGGKALIALPLGAGKTAVAVETVRRLGARRIMVTAPLNTFGGWERHFNMFMPDLPVHYIGREHGDSALDLLKAGEEGVWIVGWEYGRGARRQKVDEHGNKVFKRGRNGKQEKVMVTIREQLDWSKYKRLEAVIVDESARMANRKSIQTKVVWSSKKVPIKLALSATPAGNRIEGIWSTLHWLWPERFRYFGPWADAYLEKEVNHHAKTQGGAVVYNYLGEKRKGIVAKSIPVYAKRTEEEVHGELPGVVEHFIEVDMTPAQHKVYRQFENEALAWLDGHPVAAALPITKRIRLHQTTLAVPTVVEQDGEKQVTFAENAKSSKIDALLEILNDLPPEEKVLVWTHSKRIVPVVAARLTKAGHSAVQATGGQTQREREAALTEFKEGDAQVLVATVPTLSEGVDGLQHVCATEVWLSKIDGLTLNRQAEGRLLRPGQKRVINRFIIAAKRTVETMNKYGVDGDGQLGRLLAQYEDLKDADMM